MPTLDLLHGDCLEIMKDISSNTIDCFICDLPYGCLTGGGKIDSPRAQYGKPSDGHACSWDVKIDLEKFWAEVERLMKHDNVPIIHFCTSRFGYELIKSKEKWFRYDIVWEKNVAVGFLCANKMPMRSHEMIYVFSKKSAKYIRKDIEGDFKKVGGGPTSARVYNNWDFQHLQPDNEGKRCVRSVIKFSKNTRPGKHPTEKPMDLYKWLIERYCPPGGTLLDPTAGSFNSCFAALELNRNSIGIEKDDKFFQKACDRADKL